MENNQYLITLKATFDTSRRIVRKVGPLNIAFVGIAWFMWYQCNYAKWNTNPRYSYTMPYLQSPRQTRGLYEKI